MGLFIIFVLILLAELFLVSLIYIGFSIWEMLHTKDHEEM